MPPCFDAKVAALGWGIKIRMYFHNSCVILKLYEQDIKGVVQDFIISFDEEHTDMFLALNNTLDLFQQLIETNLKTRQCLCAWLQK